VQLQRLDRLARALVPRRAQVVRGFSGAVVERGGRGDDEEGRPCEQDDLGRALQAWANGLRCLDRTAALGMVVCTNFDHACARQFRHAE